jgi:aspartate carbamoyltransferase regulatory subunit
VLYKAAHNALCQKVSYLFWNLDHAAWFKMTEFLPLFDEHDGSLKAGFRFWSLDWNKKPVIVVMYEQDGYTKYQTKEGSSGLDLVMIEDKKGYKQQVAHNEVDPDEVVGYSNYSYLPIVPLYGNKHHQSDLIGMRGKIDAYDLINSGFANDLQECAEIYWLIGNAMGETDETLAKFRDRIKLNHIAVADVTNSSVTPYTQEIPVTAKETMLNRLHDQLYSDYGALDVHTISAGTTNDHIDAAYQPVDEEADDFEYQIIECVRGILALIGEDDVPVFNRNRISNQKERTEMVMLAAQYLDDKTIINKLPFITPDEVDSILLNRESVVDTRLENDLG